MTGTCAKDDVTAVLQGAIDGVVCLLCLPSIRNPDKLAVPNVDAYSCTRRMRWKECALARSGVKDVSDICC